MKEKKKGMRKKRGEREKKSFVCVWRLGASRQVDLPQILYKKYFKVFVY